MSEKTQTKAAAWKPMSIRRSIFWLLFSGVILIVGGHFFWSVVAGYSLERAIVRLHATGEPTMPADLHLDDVPDEQNASLDYKAAGDFFQDKTESWKKFDLADAGAFSYPLTDDERDTVSAIITENAALLDRVARARGKIAGGWKDDFSHPSILLDMKLNGSRSVAQVIKLSAMLSQMEHEDDRAVQAVCDGLLLANAAERRPSLIAHLVAVGIEALATDNAGWLTKDWKPGRNGLNRPQLVTLLKLLQDESPSDQGVRFGFETERMMTVGSLKAVADGTLSLSAMGQPGTSSSAVFSYIFRPTFRDDARLSLHYFQDVINDSAAPDWITASRQYPAWFKQKTQQSFILHPGASMLVPSMEKSVSYSFRAKAQRRLTSVAVACRLYAADHDDQLPASLTDLVPDYLPAVPIDSMSGKPLLFKSDPPRVYSVGDDGNDDGGVPVNPAVPLRNHPPGDVVVYLTPHPRGYPFSAPADKPATRPDLQRQSAPFPQSGR